MTQQSVMLPRDASLLAALAFAGLCWIKQPSQREGYVAPWHMYEHQDAPESAPRRAGLRGLSNRLLQCALG